jgi:hypothetical protein
MKPTRRFRLKPLQSGQIWRMGESNLQVELVGKLLVHYKLVKHEAKRTPTSISGKETVEKYLAKNRAILIQE